MIEIIGALLIIVSTTAIGNLLSRRFRERPRQLRQWRSALQSLEAEITFGLSPVGDASVRLADQLPQPIASFFLQLAKRLNEHDCSLKEAWEDTIQNFWPRTALNKNEREIMSQFGATLGLSDRDNQQKQIRLALSHLEREEAEARQAQGQYEKLLKSLGFLSGLLIVILLF